VVWLIYRWIIVGFGVSLLGFFIYVIVYVQKRRNNPAACYKTPNGYTASYQNIDMPSLLKKLGKIYVLVVLVFSIIGAFIAAKFLPP